MANMRTGTYTSRMATRGSPLSTVCEKMSTFLVTVARFFRVRGTVCAYSVLDLSAYGAGSFSRRTKILVRQGSDFFQFLAKSTNFHHRVNRLDPTQYACFHFFGYFLTFPVGGIYGDTYMSTALQDFLICLEMPLFALAHMYAFSHLDYIPRTSGLVGRMPFLFALRDSFGTGDVVADTLATVHGTNYTYRSWEPSEDVRHHLYAFKGRSRAGLRYTDDGRTKYWINGNATAHGDEGTPLRIASQMHYLSTNNECDELADVHFPKLTQEEEILYQLSRKLPFGDYRYPCIQA